uniref:Uncharacterized protein n=1 Tax=Aegilops tauschii subsp. strangulata TaxID=200361 RepID=A0A453M3D0_AEGTS
LIFGPEGAAAEQGRATLAAAPWHPRRRRSDPHPPLLFGSEGAAAEQGRATLAAAPHPLQHINKKMKSGIVGSSIFAMWEKASKARKTDEVSTPNQTADASSTCTSPVHLESNLQLVLWQEPESRGETSTPHVEDDESIDEDDEPMQADFEALEHDPRKRIPISVYAVSDQDRVRTRYIEMGSCQPKNHKFKLQIKVEKSVAFAVFGSNNFHGLSIVWKNIELSALFAICSRIRQDVPVEMLL